MLGGRAIGPLIVNKKILQHFSLKRKESKEDFMKHFTKLLVTLIALPLTVGIISCSTPSSSDDNNSPNSSGNPSGTNQKTVLYWDTDSNTFKGTVSYTAKTFETQMLLTGFVDNVTWGIEAPSGFPEYTYGGACDRYGTYSVNPETYTITADFQTDEELFKVWAQVPGVKVTVRVNFTTGAHLDIASQDGYGYAVNVDDFYWDSISQFLYACPHSNPEKRYNDREIKLYYYGFGNKAYKVKSATAYIYGESGNLIGTYTAVNDWTDMNALAGIASSSSIPQTSFNTPQTFNLNWLNSIAPNGWVKMVITFLGGEEIEGSFTTELDS